MTIAPIPPIPWNEKTLIEKILTIGLPVGVGLLLFYFLFPEMIKGLECLSPNINCGNWGFGK
jgi:hypothetical protein